MPLDFVNFNAERNPVGATFEETERRRALAQQLGNAQPIDGIRSNAQGFAHVLGKGIEAYQTYKADQADKARNTALAQALGAMQPEGVPPELWQTLVTSDPSNMANVALQSAQQRAQAQREAQAKALERQQEQDWWRQQQDYQRSNPMPTDDMREYEVARQQGYQGSLQDWITSGRKAGATQVNVGNSEVGTIPQGYELMTGPDGGRSMRPIPGGPAAIEQEAAAQADANRAEGQMERSGLVAEEIDRALGVMDSGILPDTGWGSMLSGVPGTDAKALSSLLDTIKANIGFDELNKMRAQSKTGGALGEVAERELAFLQSVAGSLDQGQSAEQLRYNLNRLWNGYMDVIHGSGKGPKRRPLQSMESDLSGMSDAELEAIANGR